MSPIKLTAPSREAVAGTLYGLAYYRVSTAEQANTSYDEDGFSIQAQREYCQRKSAEMGVHLVDEYIDRGKSARTADRPALQAMRVIHAPLQKCRPITAEMVVANVSRGRR
jgi:site-specific DNA recombinase